METESTTNTSEAPVETAADLPDYRSWSIAAVKLLQGVVYSDDTKTWCEVLESRRVLNDYFARIGLTLIVDEANSFAYLRQLDSDREGIGKDYAELPKLYRQTRLGYGGSLICVMLREELRRFETEEVDSELCAVEEADLFEQWKAYSPAISDEARLHREFKSALKSAADAGFVHQLKGEPPTWEVRRILKAKLDARRLEQLRDELIAYQKEKQTSS